MNKPATLEASDDAVAKAEDYYDSSDADNFYAIIWGGEDIHIGLYESPAEPIRDASHKTVLRMAERLEGLKPGTRVLDVGAGFGGAARVIAKKYGAHVTCLNLSEVENERNRKLTAEQGLSDLVNVVHGSFEEIPEPDNSFDFVWSQDAILHSGNRKQVLKEIARVLKPGGQFIFTDPMQADNLKDESVLAPIYDRIHLDSLGSFAFYREKLGKLGFEEVMIEDLTPQLRTHYDRVGKELANRRGELTGKVSDDYIDRMLVGLKNWVNGADNGHLAWGIMHFRLA
ncbi:MAG TPA: methyltransferase domain-containing protein [Alphaproteobacteria bacterium]|nr:methyltransferase domain-containing protein [Alphaproteobacteria bacterium]